MLDKAKKLVRQKEAVREQQNILKREETTLDYIESKGKVPRTHQQTASEHKKCIRCGKTPTPGRTAQLRTLNVTSVESMATSVQSVFQKTAALISEDSSDTELIETSYLNAVTEISKPTRCWKIQVKVDGKEVSFVIDTGLKCQLYQRTSSKLLTHHSYISQRKCCVVQVDKHSMYLAVVLSRFLTRT